MKLVVSTKDYAVIDDFMPPEMLSAVWAGFQKFDFHFVQRDKWKRRYALADGQRLEAKGLLTGQPDGVENNSTFMYPSGNILDRAVDHIFSSQDMIEAWSGRRGDAWNEMAIGPSIWPAGARLNWHVDKTNIVASLIHYVHPAWGASWGGELLIAEPSSVSDATRDYIKKSPDWLNLTTIDPPGASSLSEEVSIGTYISPKPNRLVIMAPGTVHSVQPVSVSAGENFRCTLLGYFFRVNRAKPNMIRDDVDFVRDRELTEPLV